VIRGGDPGALASTSCAAIMRTYIVSPGCCHCNVTLDRHELFADDSEFQETSLRIAAGHVLTHGKGVCGIRHEHELVREHCGRPEIKPFLAQNNSSKVLTTTHRLPLVFGAARGHASGFGAGSAVVRSQLAPHPWQRRALIDRWV
jgi:hypothetical protein